VDFAGFLRAAERGQLPPIALIHGADPQLSDDALAAATSALFPEPSLVALGRETFDARELALDDLVRAASTLPLMTSARLIVVRHTQALKSSPSFAEYVRDPNPTTTILFLADESLEAGRDRKRHWLLDVLPSSAVITLVARQGRALIDWLRQRASEEGLHVSEEAARLLVEWVGDDTGALLGETRKAALVGASGPGNVGVKDVTAVVGEQRLAGVFDLTRAIERRDVGVALRTLDRLLSSEEPMRLCALLAGEIRLLWNVGDLTRRGQSPEQIARTLRRPPGVIAARVTAATATSTATLAAHLKRCWDVERRLKSGGDAHAELATLVGELCRQGG
jgi:DNA polymerase III subunit delta